MIRIRITAEIVQDTSGVCAEVRAHLVGISFQHRYLPTLVTEITPPGSVRAFMTLGLVETLLKCCCYGGGCCRLLPRERYDSTITSARIIHERFPITFAFLTSIRQAWLIRLFIENEKDDQYLSSRLLTRQDLETLVYPFTISPGINFPPETRNEFIKEFVQKQAYWFLLNLSLELSDHKVQDVPDGLFLPIEFDGENLVGEGTHGRIYLGTTSLFEEYPRRVAVKIFGSGEDGNNARKREWEMNRHFRHRSIRRALAAVNYRNMPMIVYPEVSCDLSSIIQNNRALNVFNGDAANRYHHAYSERVEPFWTNIRGLISALAEMHNDPKNHWYHLDVKPKNILVTYDGRWLIGDFGGAFRKDRIDNEDDLELTVIIRGLGEYSPPENHCIHLLRRSGDHERCSVNVSKKSDVWSLGCVFCVVLVWMFTGPEGVEKFHQDRSNSNTPAITDRIRNVRGGVTDTTASFHNRGSRCSAVDATLNGLCRRFPSPRIKRFVEILLSMLICDPEQRPSAKDIKEEIDRMLPPRRTDSEVLHGCW